MNDLAIILVSHNGASWLRACLDTVLGHIDQRSVDIVVVNNADDGTEAVVSGYPAVRFIRCENRGFSHANNRGLATCDARYYLLLNVDTEVVDGTFDELVDALDQRPSVGLAGVRQLTSDGRLAPTIRRFPSPLRSLGDALGAEKAPIRIPWLGERELSTRRYDHECRCDWVSGSFLVIRREALASTGFLDERFFLYSEEPDLCFRGKQAGWETRYLPVMTIIHHGGSARLSSTLAAQDAFSRMQFAQKHFGRARRMAYALTLGIGYSLRAVSPGSRGDGVGRRRAAKNALRTLIGLSDPPFGSPIGRGVEPLEHVGEVQDER